MKAKKILEDVFNFESYDHDSSITALCQRLDTDPEKGLTTKMVKQRRNHYGQNSLKPPKGLNPFYRFLVHNFQGADCVAAIGIVLFLTNYTVETFANQVLEPDIEKIYVTMTLSLFIVFVGAYSFLIERKAIRILENIRKTISKTKCLVVRDGCKSLLDVVELTVGDLVEIHCGDRVPADIRVIQTTNFQVDNSTITTDPTPIVVTTRPTSRNPLASRNLIFATTFAVAGKCKGIVLKVGDSTVIGHLGRENTLLKQMYTPLIHRFNKVVLLYCGIAGVLSFMFTFLVMTLDYKFLDVSTVYIAIFCAMVPEKLLICLHTNHILAASRMKTQNSFIKHFEGIETLGQCSVICCGKSGIITEDSFEVSQVWFGGSIFDANSLSEDQLRSESFGILTRSMHLNVQHHLLTDNTHGSTSASARGEVELAIIQYLKAIGSIQESKKVINDIMFSSARMHQLSVHCVDYDPRLLLVAMGAPEIILKKCSTILMNGAELKLDRDIRNDVSKLIQDMAVTGEQVVGFCEIFLPVDKFREDMSTFEEKPEFPTHRFRFVGLVSFKNPVRASVNDSVAVCKAAGIKIVLMSGDCPTTTEAVARSAGIISDGMEVHDSNVILESLLVEDRLENVMIRALMVTGESLESMTAAEIKYLLCNYKEIIFASIRPHQKLVIVKCFQELREVVAFTGKTIGDSSALKKANIGLVPMKASDIARHSADIILADAGFTSIEKGIQEGRLVFENFRKSICYELATNLPKLVPFFLYMIIKIPLPLSAISILVIDIGIDFLSAVSLSYEKAESHLMSTSSKKDESIITKMMILRSYFHIGILETCAGMLVYFAVMTSNGFLPSSLIGLRNDWLDAGNDALRDSYGQEWSYEQRKRLEANSHTGYLCAIIITQFANLICSRTNYSSLLKVKCNLILLATIAIELVFAGLLASVNLGWFDQSLKLREIRWVRILLILPFAMIIIVYDELRKYMIRRCPNGWIAKNLQYM